MGKKYDPRMHTAEHILNQTMDRMFQTGRSFNAHIEVKKSKCDYRLSRPLSPHEINAVEEKINEIISRDLPVTESLVTREEAVENYNMKKVPDSAGDTIRIVRVGDYDAVPCIGDHVRSTGEIGRFHIASSDHQEDRLRLRFKLEETEADKGADNETG